MQFPIITSISIYIIQNSFLFVLHVLANVFILYHCIYLIISVVIYLKSTSCLFVGISPELVSCDELDCTSFTQSEYNNILLYVCATTSIYMSVLYLHHNVCMVIVSGYAIINSHICLFVQSQV
jgi:hypothetical protein